MVYKASFTCDYGTTNHVIKGLVECNNFEDTKGFTTKPRCPIATLEGCKLDILKKVLFFFCFYFFYSNFAFQK